MPYLGYFQLIKAVDTFVVYDDIEYTKKGYITRNSYLTNAVSKQFSLSLKKDSDYLNVCDRVLSDNFDRKKLLNQISASYKKAPYFDIIFDIFNEIVLLEDSNLFNFIFNSIKVICDYLELQTQLVISSSIKINHNLKSQDKVLKICKELQATQYINAIGGQILYSFDEFKRNNIELSFIKMGDIKYKQFNNEFVPNLSIIDVLMFNSKEDIKLMLENYTLICKED